MPWGDSETISTSALLQRLGAGFVVARLKGRVMRRRIAPIVVAQPAKVV
jgi:hypothetical protein